MDYFKKNTFLYLSSIRGIISLFYFILTIISIPNGFMINGIPYISVVLFNFFFCIILVLPEILYSLKSTEELWNKWESSTHSSKAQHDRIERALVYTELVPVKIRPDARCGKFAGQSSSKRYLTTLRSCTCPDFKKRHVPCKHMYYLANECGIDVCNY